MILGEQMQKWKSKVYKFRHKYDSRQFHEIKIKSFTYGMFSSSFPSSSSSSSSSSLSSSYSTSPSPSPSQFTSGGWNTVNKLFKGKRVGKKSFASSEFGSRHSHKGLSPFQVVERYCDFHTSPEHRLFFVTPKECENNHSNGARGSTDTVGTIYANSPVGAIGNYPNIVCDKSPQYSYKDFCSIVNKEIEKIRYAHYSLNVVEDGNVEIVDGGCNCSRNFDCDCDCGWANGEREDGYAETPIAILTAATITTLPQDMRSISVKYMPISDFQNEVSKNGWKPLYRVNLYITDIQWKEYDSIDPTKIPKEQHPTS
ncbi:predicted protein [Lodderomyces elongisporus NRRL YB-4239]|uniref:Uncharacterized protein n=1 Tax=Lodderomyces elongisporus (strain ATCC 11503 / CBS 2605 / JCM 1781 / NBRC 1676 / NRRL YB-4239) TaxID=379508 RepID=A5DTU1_LODEL|nr:predicted protein [Lodderomyces elongisporus NRRL YB-4239]